MATIRIADPTYTGDEPSCDDGSAMGPAFSKSQSTARSHQEELHESIYNIRSRSRIPERISSRISAAEQPDDDPGLRNPGDFKQRQVGNATMRNHLGTNVTHL
jgi:KUP system potassium uptake protein